MNHLMMLDATVEPLRETHKRATRERIVRAVSELVAEAHPAAISVPAVAARAGVGVATVYRYFPTKEALLDASALVMGSDAAITSLAQLPQSFDELAALLPATFADLARHLPLARNQLASPLGRELRQRRWEAKQVAMRAALEGSGIDPDAPEGKRFAAIADVLTSSTALLELHDKAGIPVEDAAAHVLWALSVLEQSTRGAKP
jgi:AcrR family transcriptional regulator